MQPVPAEPAVTIPSELLSKLGSEAFADRVEAEKALLTWSRGQSDAAKDLLFQASRSESDPEVRGRCLGVLRALVDDEYSKDGQGFMGIRMGLAVVQIQIEGENAFRFAIQIDHVEDGSPAQKGGLVMGDFLLAIDDRVWTKDDTLETVTDFIKSFKPGTKVKARIARAGKPLDLVVELGRRPIAADAMRLMPFGALGLGGMAVPNQAVIEAAEKQAKEDYFRNWLARKKAAGK
ncbi:MAG: PDZ domain-containing protein [Verrucomicrobia bacterium]|nr:PDZ domain-containing protein [Verrucomicrobiota bacterium]